MRASIRSSNLSGLAGAVAALWLGAGVAWAGDGQDLGSLQALLSNSSKTGICDVFMKGSPCPIPSTITQAVLEVAALGNNLLEMIRAQNNIPPGTSVNAGNAAAVPPVDTSGNNLPMPFPVNSTSNPPLFVAGNATTPPSGLLTTLTPLAFASQSSGTAQPTQLYNTTADTFLYAVGASVGGGGFIGFGGLTDPDMVYFFYEDLSRTSGNLAIGQIVAKVSLPLTVLNKDGTEVAVPTTLNFIGTKAGDCSSSTVVGNFSNAASGTQTLMASQIGIECAVVFSGSPTSTQTHAFFEAAVPLLVTGATPPPNTDPLYFYSRNNKGKGNPINTGVATPFEFNDPGYPPPTMPPTPLPSVFPAGAVAIGLAPSAGPLALPASGTPNYALCADLPSNGNGLSLRPAVGAYYAMATSGEMLLSAPLPSAFVIPTVPPSIPPVCPQL
jgi:hypothetical protein